jgi:hypothetical protein
MTKAQEISIITECANRLGPDSYCGPWLLERIQEVESLIRSDILPTVTFADSSARCREILTAADERASEIKQRAQDEANKAQMLRHRVNERACATLREALKTLENL